MKKCLLLLVTAGLILSSCGGRPAAPTADTQATVDAAVAATSTAQARAQATVDAAVRATQNAASPTADTQATVEAAVQATSAAQATVEAAVQATVAARPTPTPSPDTTTLSEEELAALIEEAMSEASAAADTCAESSAAAAADDSITYEELLSLLVYAEEVDELVAYAGELLAAYDEMYGALAGETLETLQAIEQDLAALAEEMAALVDVLEEINATLAEGLELAEETIAQLEAAAAQAQSRAAEMQGLLAQWQQALQQELEARAKASLDVQPNTVAGDRLGAIQAAFEYVDAVRASLADHAVSVEELAQIAQLGANAAASLEARGGAKLQGLAANIDEITAMVARGEIPQVQAQLGSLEAALGSRPARP